jgi:hypothetical protein
VPIYISPEGNLGKCTDGATVNSLLAMNGNQLRASSKVSMLEV